MIKEEYKNIIAFHPGYYLNDIIEDLEMSQEDFAKRLGTTAKTVSKLLNGQTPLTNDLALKASLMLGISMETLLNLQKKYDEKVLEIERQKRLDAQIEIINQIDYSYFIKNNFLPAVSNVKQKIENLCAFLKVSDLTILKSPDLLASFRTSVQNVTDKNIINANVWLQTAINMGYEAPVDQYNEKKLKSYIPEIRSMTLQNPDLFLPRLKEIFKECGVAFVLLPALKNSGINGVVKWYDEKVVLAINDRNTYADTFWFSLFHEIKHVLQRKKTKVIINDDVLSAVDEYLENDANEFARATLIPPEKYYNYFRFLGKYISREQILEFSRQISIHPGIVVGRLQHDKRIPFTHFSDLREKYHIIV